MSTYGRIARNAYFPRQPSLPQRRPHLGPQSHIAVWIYPFDLVKPHLVHHEPRKQPRNYWRFSAPNVRICEKGLPWRNQYCDLEFA